MSLSAVTPILTAHASTSTSPKWIRSRSWLVTFSSWRKRVKIAPPFFAKGIHRQNKQPRHQRHDGDKDDQRRYNDGTSYDHDQTHATTSIANPTTNASGLKSTGKGAKKRRGGVVIDDEEAESEEIDDEEDVIPGDDRPPASFVLRIVLFARN